MQESPGDPATYCSSDLPRDYVVCIKGEHMGEGDPELGRVLMETFVENLKLQEQLPTHVILYNGGVKFALKSSPMCSSLAELEELTLSTIGENPMISLTETLAAAGHVITP